MRAWDPNPVPDDQLYEALFRQQLTFCGLARPMDRGTAVPTNYEGKTSAEIAGLPGVADGTVRWRISEESSWGIAIGMAVTP
jgi:hypothetical protein